MKQERMTLSQKELDRIRIIGALVDGRMTNREAAEKLGLCQRQIIRIKKRFVAQGAAGLVHGNRGRTSRRRIGDEVRESVLKAYEEVYYDFNFSHFAECLNEREGIGISRSSVVRILKDEGIRSKKSVRRRPKLHRSRPRKVAAGMLWQTDATSFEWFGRGNGRATLHAYIDDATGIVTGACFTENECMAGYVAALGMGIEGYGLPMAIYSDRHTIFRSPKARAQDDEDRIEENERNEENEGNERNDGNERNEAGKGEPLSCFGRGLKDLGIGQIFALTPEAKGRVERLWNTMQDRLPGELRLLGVSDITAANEVLPKLIARHNRKFAVTPAEGEDVYVKPEGKVDLDFLFARRESRRTDHGGMISYGGRRYVPAADDCLGMAKTTVEVRETSTGRIWGVSKGRRIEMKEVERQKRVNSDEASAKKRKSGLVKAHKPAPDHPWRHGVVKRQGYHSTCRDKRTFA